MIGTGPLTQLSAASRAVLLRVVLEVEPVLHADDLEARRGQDLVDGIRDAGDRGADDVPRRRSMICE